MIQAVVELSKKLGIATIAEGVETQAQVARLTEFGVDALQGFYSQSRSRPKS